ncbi:glutathione S-transferase [Polynucleobacter sp. SHI8]|nr:glutathione S-transferase [Polynucleobacter sp. SHI2]BDW13160.1 glutathione S-transferase [Polynucleobacter sp. SHI8]
MRARCALIYAKIDVEIREIELRSKPQSMLTISPKGTVPVLLTKNQLVIDQSIDVMYWALDQNDPQQWLPEKDSFQRLEMERWIEVNDGSFKQLLDQYKYPERFPELVRAEVLDAAMNLYLLPLNEILENKTFLLGDKISMLDIALFPFVRQFMASDSKKFHELPLKKLAEWLNFFILSDLFHQVMAKYPIWRDAE